MGGFGGYGGFNQPFYPGLNSYSSTNGQGYNAYNMLAPGKHCSLRHLSSGILFQHLVLLWC